ncbi:MAG: glycosyltransferase [Sciscionella sp.]
MSLVQLRKPVAVPRGGARMRVLISAETFPPDINGAARFAQRLAGGLAGRGHDVHVVCPATGSASSWELMAGVTLHRIASHRTPFHPTFRVCLPGRAYREVARLLDELRPDVVHTQAHFLIGRALVSEARLRGVPVLATNHFMPENLLGYLKCPTAPARGLVRWAWRDLAKVYGGADLVTAPTPSAVELLREGGFRGEAIAVSCGIDLDRHSLVEAREDPVPTVLFVGRLDEEKHVNELVEAMALLQEGLVAGAEIVGDGSCRARLEALAQRRGVAGRIRFRGFVSDSELLACYARCAVFCMPGVAELQSLATMEAMTAGKPVVAADAVALPHLVRPGRNGWLYPPGDVEALAVRLAAVLGDSRERARLGAGSLQIIAGHGMAHTLDTFETLYHRVMARRSAAPISQDAARAPISA